MKKKILIVTILITFIASLLLSFYEVEAYTGEIDPENYITLPSTIYIKDKVGTGTVRLSSSVSGYNISYQKIDITKEKSDSISDKLKEVNNYIESSNKTIKEKETNLTTLKTEYENLQKESTTTEEELTAARTKYKEAYTEYTEYYETTKTQVEKLKKEYLALIPDYTSSWKTTTNSLNNIELDFSNYTGTAYFILWVKIDNGTSTYYDFMGYSSDIEEETKIEDEEKKDTTTDGDWTDFSKAKFELKKEGISGALIEISGVTPKENSSYYLFITSDSSKPNVNGNVSDERISLIYDKNSKTLKTVQKEKVAQYVELNQDLYVSIVERQKALTDNVVTYGNKLTRFSEAKYSDAFFATFMTNDADQLITNFTHNQSNNRKMQIKVGKITDTSILQKIKTKNSTGFEDLLSYAKSNSGIYNQTLDADRDDGYAIEYNAGAGETKGNSVINIKGLENKEYYFLYIKTDDENGKYISNEAVTLAEAKVYDNGWGLFFYGSSDFKWSEWGTTSKDDTTSPSKIPYAGLEIAIFGSVILVVLAIGIIAYKKYQKYNF